MVTWTVQEPEGAVYDDDAAEAAATITLTELDDMRALRTDLAANTGSGLSGFIQAGTGAGDRTSQAKARERISVEDFYQNTSQDATAWQRALDRIKSLGGGTVHATANSYVMGAQVTADLEGSGWTGPLHIVGNGAKINTTGAISALDFQGIAGLQGVRVSGLSVYHPGNTTALAGFRQRQTARFTFEHCWVLADASVIAGYTGFQIGQKDDTDPNTNCFWTSFPNCGVRSTGGITVPNAVRMQGQSNATDFGLFYASGVVKGIRLEKAPGDLSAAALVGFPNGVRVVGAWIEGVTDAVYYAGLAGGYGPYGLEINSRIETAATILNLQGATLNSGLPPKVVSLHTLQSVTTMVTNPNGLYVNTEDYRNGVGATNESRTYTRRGVVVTGIDAAYHPLRVAPANTGSGFVVDYANAPGTVGLIMEQLGGSVFEIGTSHATTGLDLKLRNVKGITSTDTHACNLSGSKTFATAATAVVTFAVNEPDASYQITGTGNANETFWITGKGTTGFTIHSSNATSVAVYDWHLLR